MSSQITALFARMADTFREKPLRFTAVLCGFLIALVYSGMPAEELTFDSAFVVGGDTRLQQYEIGSMARIFEKDYWWPSLQSNLFRPLTTLGFWVEYCFLGYGATPLGYQITNALLHWLNALLVFVLARKLWGARTGGLWCAMIYAVHPIATEAVANIVGRSDLLAALAVFGGLICYLTALEKNDSRPRVRWLAAAGACGLAGVLAKESAIVLPALIAWHGLLRIRELKTSAETKTLWLRDAGWSAALLAPAAIVFFATRYIFSQQPGVTDHPFIDNPLVLSGFWVSKITAFSVWGQQLAALFNPTSLSSDYSFNAIPVAALMFGNATAVAGWITLLVFLAVATFLFLARKKLAEGVVFLAGAYVIAMLPTSNLLINIGSIRADRFHYLPSAFFWLFLFLSGRHLASCAMPAWATENRRRGALALVICGFLCLSAIAHVRCYDWRSNLNLWRSAVVGAPGSAKAQAALANEMVRARNDEQSAREAVARAEESLAMYSRLSIPPEYWPYMILSDLGAFSTTLHDEILKVPGREAEAAGHLEIAIKWLERGIEYEALSRQRWARRWAGGDLDEAPLFEMLHRNHVVALHRQKRWVEAAAKLDVLLAKMPFKAELRDLRAQNLHGQNQIQEAVDAWTLLALMHPNKDFYINDLGAAIVELDKSAKPLERNEKGELRLSLENDILVASLRRSWKVYDSILAKHGMELERAQLKRAIRYRYGIKSV